MVSISPRAAEQHLLVRDQAAQPHRVHRDAVHAGTARPVGSWVVASGTAPRPASCTGGRDQAAVRAAVPDGASTLSGWCSSMTSTDS